MRWISASPILRALSLVILGQIVCCQDTGFEDGVPIDTNSINSIDYDSEQSSLRSVSSEAPLTHGSTTDELLMSDEDPINHSLEQERLYSSSTEGSIADRRADAEQWPMEESKTMARYEERPVSEVATGGDLMTSDGMSPLAQSTIQQPSTSQPMGMAGDFGMGMMSGQMAQPSTVAQQGIQSERRLGTEPMGPVMIPMASERTWSRPRRPKRKKAPGRMVPMSMPMPFPAATFSHHHILPMAPMQHVPVQPPVQPPPRNKRRPGRGRSGGRPMRRGRGKKPRGKPSGKPAPNPPQPYGLGSMQLPTYAPAFVSYGPIFGPPPGIHLKHPVHAQAYGMPTQQSVTYVPLVSHGPGGVLPQTSQSNQYHQQYLPFGSPNGHQSSGPSNDPGRPALTISVEAPSNMYPSAPAYPDGSPVSGPGKSMTFTGHYMGATGGSMGSMGQMGHSMGSMGPHPVPGYNIVAGMPNYGPRRPMPGPAPPLGASGPSFTAPLPAPSSQGLGFAQPTRAHPTYHAGPYNNNNNNNHGPNHPNQQSGYNPPMHYGSPMHNFGPPMSSFGQPPPIMGDPQIDKWAPPTGFNSYPGGAGYSSHENFGGSYKSEPSSNAYSSGYDYAPAGKTTYYKNYPNGAGNYKDFRASQEDPQTQYPHSDESGYSSGSSNFGSSPSTYESTGFGSGTSTGSPQNNYYKPKPKRKQRKPSSSGYTDTYNYEKDPYYKSNAQDDDFFSSNGFQSSRSKSPYKWKRRRTGDSGTYDAYTAARKSEDYDATYDTTVKTPAASSSYNDGTTTSNSGYADASPTINPSSTGRSGGRSTGSSGRYERPEPHYDTQYNSPGMSKDQKVTDWFDYAERTHDQKLKLGYPKRYKKKVLRYKTLPESVDGYHSDPNHRKYPKLTYDSLKYRSTSRNYGDKTPKFLSEESKIAVFKTGPEFKQMLSDHDQMRL